MGSDGRFRFERLTPGSWQVVLRDEEVLPGQMATWRPRDWPVLTPVDVPARR